MNVPFRGGRARGAIRYEAAAAPLVSVNFHCRDCQRGSGSALAPLLIEEPARPKIVLLLAASLDHPSQHAPQMDIFTSRVHPWDVMSPALPKFPEMPPLADSLGR